MVLAAESFSFSGDDRAEEQAVRIAKHVAGVRKMRGFGQAVCVMGIENNLGESVWNISNNVERIRASFSGLPHIVYLREPRNDQLGIRMTDVLKPNMAKILAHRVQSRRFCFHRRFFTLSDPNPHAVRAKLIGQLLNYERKLKRHPNDPDAAIRVRYSGKSHGLDDLAMCVQINCVTFSRHQQQIGGP